MRGAVLVVLTSMLGPGASLATGVVAAVESEAALRFAGIVHQQQDHTCGYAAAATILRSLGMAADERSVLAHSGDSSGGRGATLAGIGRAAAHWGVESFAVRSTWEKTLAYFGRYDEPVLALVRADRPHFTVVLAADPRGVYLADPSLGYLVLAPSRFAQRWTGVLVFLRPRDGSGLANRSIAAALERMRSRHRNLLRMQTDLDLAARSFGVGWYR